MILGLIQARMSSTRLPGKVLRPLCGEPMIFRQIERLKESKSVKNWMVVTSEDASDQLLVEECKKRNVDVFTGSLDDVLDRFYQAGRRLKPDLVVRSTGDCPLIDPEVLDSLVKLHIDGKFDYSSNALQPSFPDGLDCEIFRWEALEKAWKEARLPSEREHVTPYLYKGFPENPKFKVGLLRSNDDLSSLRWTVDEESDFQFVTRVYEALYPVNKHFRMKDVLKLLESQGELADLNRGIERNEGYRKSLKKDPKGL